MLSSPCLAYVLEPMEPFDFESQPTLTIYVEAKDREN